MFNLLIQAIFPPIASFLIEELPGVFNSPDADKFHLYYSSSAKFIKTLEGLCNQQVLESLHASQPFKDYNRKWQLSVYFQLRHNQMVSEIEESMQNDNNTFSEINQTENNQMIFPQTAKTINILEKLWSPQIFLLPLKQRFWKTTLLVINRFIVIKPDFRDG